MSRSPNVKKVTVKKIHNDEYMNKKVGKFFDDKDIKIFKKDVDVYTDEGELLFKFRKNVVSKSDCETMFNNLKGAARMNTGRPDASGIPKSGKYKYIRSKSTGKMLHVLTTKARSGIAGYYDSSSHFSRNPNKSRRTPKTKSRKPKSKSKSKSKSRRSGTDTLCRMTAFTAAHLKEFEECLPIFKKVDRIYKKLIPEDYKEQEKAILKINQKYRIDDTIFTTITVNNNFRTALHKDKGDFGFGNLFVCSKGDYEGGYTMFPAYGIGVDVRNGDFIAMNVHEYHCNSKMTGDGTRISYVFYCREKMLKTCPRK